MAILFEALDDENQKVRTTAARASIGQADSRFVDRLLGWFETADEELQDNILDILNQMSHPRAKQALEKLGVALPLSEPSAQASPAENQGTAPRMEELVGSFHEAAGAKEGVPDVDEVEPFDDEPAEEPYEEPESRDRKIEDE